MRFTPATLAMSLVLLTVSSAGISQRPDAQIAPLSLEWQAKGEASKAAGDLAAANDAYESALAADPRNIRVFIALGEVARLQGLQGKAVRFYNEALLLDPTDMSALLGQGQALTEKGALTQARTTLAKMKAVCRGECTEVATLTAAIDKSVVSASADAKGKTPAEGSAKATPEKATP
jgi:cytochrome c-type biogenesis protein CcmH/NrfG